MQIGNDISPRINGLFGDIFMRENTLVLSLKQTPFIAILEKYRKLSTLLHSWSGGRKCISDKIDAPESLSYLLTAGIARHSGSKYKCTLVLVILVVLFYIIRF